MDQNWMLLERMQQIKSALGKVIVQSEDTLQIGQILHLDNSAIPVKVVREATKAEFLAQEGFITFGNDPIGPRFWEIDAVD